jgi:hypothetical protein
MNRRVFHLLAGLSVLVCIATAAVWISNVWRPNFFGRPQVAMGDLGVIAINGQTAFTWMPRNSTRWQFWSGSWSPNLANTCTWHLAGFGLDPPTIRDGILFVIPSWFIILMTLPIPVAWIIIRPARPRKGVCSNCGYDLRATPERCPECGKMPGKLA